MVELAIKTLAETGGNFLLDIAHVGVVSFFFEAFGLNGEDSKIAREFLRSKNAHGFSEFATKKGLNETYTNAFIALMGLDGSPEQVLAKAETFCLNDAMRAQIQELKDVVELLGDGESKVNINFSIVGDDAYYNGLIFKGYVEGIPHSVLTGGRYDKLLEKFDKKAQAIGFALYLGELSRLFQSPDEGVDVTVIYDETCFAEALRLARILREEGKKVLLSTTDDSAEGEIVKVKN
jgi:ATP phosphoribosyltransferase regulatory subunit